MGKIKDEPEEKADIAEDSRQQLFSAPWYLSDGILFQFTKFLQNAYKSHVVDLLSFCNTL